MRNFLPKISGVSLIFILFCAGVCTYEDKIIEAKRSVVHKAKEYLKSKPMSTDLKLFIEKHTRKKRSDNIDESQLYIVQNGKLVPFSSVKNNDFKHNEEQGFTVVPLVIPLNPKALVEKGKKIRIRDDKAATVDQELQETSSTQVLSGETKAVTSQEEPSSDYDDSENRTKETEVLQKILQDVEGLMQYKHQGLKKEGVICNLNGSWLSDAAGIRFDIEYKPSTRRKFRIHTADRIPPSEEGFLCDGSWSVFGELPFQHSGVIIVLAVHEKDKHIAMFIGECKVCEGADSVMGTWLVGRSSRDCKDQKAAHKILSDVWKREQMHSLQKKHLKELGITVKDED